MEDGSNFRGTERWRAFRERFARRSSASYDAYPDHVPPPKAVLLWRVGEREEVVDLGGYDVDQLDWKSKRRWSWLVTRVLAAYVRLWEERP